MIFLKICRNGPILRYSRDKLLCKKFVPWLYEKQAKQVLLIFEKIFVILTSYLTYIFFTVNCHKETFFAMENRIAEAIFVLSL